MAEQEVHELVIIKHRGGHEEDVHHGGVWKIAYADFMTAMMAFFLVLWLLNSTNKEAKISIRNYFNPIKLAEASMTRKGIIDEKDAQPAAAPDPGKKSKAEEAGDRRGENGLFGPTTAPDDKTAATPSDARKPEGPNPAQGPKPVEGPRPSDTTKPLEGAKPLDGAKAAPSKGPEAGKSPEAKPSGAASGGGGSSYTETQLFKDPYKALSDIAALAPPEPPPPDAKPADRAATPAGPGGDAAAVYRDPFESISPSATPQPLGARTPGPVSPQSPDAGQPPAASPRAAEPPPPGQPPQLGQPPQAQPASPAQPAVGGSSPPGAAPGKPGAAKAEGQPEAAALAAAQVDAAKLRTEMAKVLRSVAAKEAGPRIEVQATSEGVLISLTDEYDFGMFAVGSAEPQPKLVKIMEKIAQLLKGRPGEIVIRGHTDGRAYKSFTYDNWRLSSDRAEMARYMLVRGGLEDKRFEAVEGYADRRLRVPGDPSAAGNRRIEILLRVEKS